MFLLLLLLSCYKRNLNLIKKIIDKKYIELSKIFKGCLRKPSALVSHTLANTILHTPLIMRCTHFTFRVSFVNPTTLTPSLIYTKTSFLINKLRHSRKQ